MADHTSKRDQHAERSRTLLKKWGGFVSAMWLMVFSGNYTYANYSGALKEVLGINQQQLNGLSVARDIGDSCGGILGGVASNFLSPAALLCASASFGLLGYVLQWLVVAQIIAPLPYFVMAMAAMAGGTCIAWMNTVVFTASVRNFSRNRGPVAGLFKACMGLSGAVFSILCSTLFANSASIYLLMLVTIPNTFCLLSAIFFRPVPTAKTYAEERFERKSIFIFNSIASTLAIFIASLNFVPSEIKKSLAYQAGTISALVAIIAAPAFVPPVLLLADRGRSYGGDDGEAHFLKEEESKASDNDENSDKQDQSSLLIVSPLPTGVRDDDTTPTKTVSTNVNSGDPLTERLLESNGVSTTSSKALEKESKQCMQARTCSWSCSMPSSSSWLVRGIGEETPTLSLFKTWHYYILYFSLFCGCGSGVAFNNNLGQVGASLGYTTVNLFVSLFSLGNFFGRIISGNVSEYYIREAGIPRPAWMGLAKMPMILIFMWLSTGSTASLYVGSSVLGFSHGCLVTLTIPIVSELYGLKHFSTNFVLTVTYLVAGSYVFSNMAGYLYDRQAALQGDTTCYGSDCFGGTFRILACFLTLALAFDALITYISRPLYVSLSKVNQTGENSS